MSCSEIQVTILGDVADVQALLAEVKSDKAAVDSAAQQAAQSATEAQQAAQEAKEAPVKLRTQEDGVQRGAQATTYNFTGAGVTVTAKPNNAFEINIPGADTGETTIDKVRGLSTVLSQLNNNKVDGVTSQLDEAKKEISFTFKSGSNTVTTDTIDLSPLFGTTVPNPLKIYYGFSASQNIGATAIKQGLSDNVKTISGYDVTLARSDTDLKYMYVWVPDALGAVAGFTFSGTFLDVWGHVEISVDGEAGRLFVSDNPTVSTNVTFEVKQ